MPTDRMRDASTVMLLRDREGSREVFWVRRSRDVSLGGGFFAFPGGGVDESDRLFGAQLSAFPDAAWRIAAIRELFEEAGVLLTDEPLARGALVSTRRCLLEKRGTLRDALALLGNPAVTLDALHEAGRWITPPFIPVRFDARFFVAHVPPGQQPEVWPGELVDGEWISPEAAIARWSRGSALLHPPALHLLRCLQDAPFPACQPRMLSPPETVDFIAQRIEFQAGVILCPVRTPTLPPATHTNCYIVGEQECVIIDPASPYEEEQQRLSLLCDSLLQEGRRFREILLTHHHHDHIGGVATLKAKLKVPVRAHPHAIELLSGRLPIDGAVTPDEVIALPGRLGLRLRALHTPGHTPGHLCFFEESTGALFAGDMVAGIGSIVVNPPEGNMREYMASLERLRALPVTALYPSHGPVIPDGPRRIDEYVAHRCEREATIVEALRAGGRPCTAEDLVPSVYIDVAPAMYPLAARSLIAVLEKLAEEGRVRMVGDRYSLTG